LSWGDFPAGVSRFLFLSQISTAADSRDLDLRKRATRFKFWAVAARKNCSRTCFILRKRTLRTPIWFLSSARSASTFRRWRCAAAKAGTVARAPVVAPVRVTWSRDLPIVAPGALRSLRAVATALPRGHVHMRSIHGIDTNAGKPLSFRTLIAVRLGNVGELLDPIQVSSWSRIFFHANIGSDVSFLKPSQKLTVPVRRVGSNRLWEAPASFR
jgi:hypothetical protein